MELSPARNYSSLKTYISILNHMEEVLQIQLPHISILSLSLKDGNLFITWSESSEFRIDKRTARQNYCTNHNEF